MNINLNLKSDFIRVAVPLSLFGILVVFIIPSFPKENNTLNFAITLDLLLVIPFIYYQLIRKTQIPNTTVIPFMVVGLIIGSYFLPKESQLYLTLFKTWILPGLELTVLAFVAVKVRIALKKYKNIKGLTPDFYSALKLTCHEILPKKLVLPFATELAVMYYGFMDWRKRKIQENEFTYHKKSGTPELMGAFIFIIGIETIALHFLLVKWNATAAWILTALSVYTAIQVLGFARSLSKRPLFISYSSLDLKYGILNETSILLTDIEKIEFTRKPLPKNEMAKKLSPLGEIESHNVILHLKKENELVGLYGLKKRFKILALHVDEAKEFKEKIEKSLE